jgi:hypothetical protein
LTEVVATAVPSDIASSERAEPELVVVNLKIAKTLGLTIPLSLLGHADEVIE